MDQETGYFRESAKRVASEIGVSTVQLVEWLERLEADGYLKDESLNGKMVVKVGLAVDN